MNGHAKRRQKKRKEEKKGQTSQKISIESFHTSRAPKLRGKIMEVSTKSSINRDIPCSQTIWELEVQKKEEVEDPSDPATWQSVSPVSSTSRGNSPDISIAEEGLCGLCWSPHII